MTISAAGNLDSPIINAVTSLKISGGAHDGNIKGGDCFRIKRPQPYIRSKTLWTGTGAFYTPFGGITPTFDPAGTNTPTATVTKINDEELEIKIDATVGPTKDYSYRIKSIKNPYSATHDTDIDILHYVDCKTTGTATPYNGPAPTLGISSFQKDDSFCGLEILNYDDDEVDQLIESSQDVELKNSICMPVKLFPDRKQATNSKRQLKAYN